MSKEWLWWLGEFGLVAVVAIVAGFVTKDVPISILYGLFVGTVFFSLREHKRVVAQHERQVAEMEDKALNLPVTLRDRTGIDPYLKQVAQSARDEAIRVAKEIANGGVILNLRHYHHVLTDVIQLAIPGDKVLATNYGVMAGTPEQTVMIKKNIELAEKGVDITRVFIESSTATPEEKKRLREAMDIQKGPIKVRFVKETSLPQEVRGYNMITIVGRYAGYSFWSKLVGTSIRQIPHELRVYSNPDELKKAQDLIETVIKLSEEYK